jgi:hypothetical protein
MVRAALPPGVSMGRSNPSSVRRAGSVLAVAALASLGLLFAAPAFAQSTAAPAVTAAVKREAPPL